MKCIGGDRIPLIIFPIFKPVISPGIKCSRCALHSTAEKRQVGWLTDDRTRNPTNSSRSFFSAPDFPEYHNQDENDKKTSGKVIGIWCGNPHSLQNSQHRKPQEKTQKRSNKPRSGVKEICFGYFSAATDVVTE